MSDARSVRMSDARSVRTGDSRGNLERLIKEQKDAILRIAWEEKQKGKEKRK
jgi:hypothetical protein